MMTPPLWLPRRGWVGSAWNERITSRFWPNVSVEPSQTKRSIRLPKGLGVPGGYGEAALPTWARAVESAPVLLSVQKR